MLDMALFSNLKGLIGEDNRSRNAYDRIRGELGNYFMEDLDNVVLKLNDKYKETGYKNYTEKLFEDVYDKFESHIKTAIWKCGLALRSPLYRAAPVKTEDLKKILYDHVVGISYLTLDMYKTQNKESEYLVPLSKIIQENIEKKNSLKKKNEFNKKKSDSKKYDKDSYKTIERNNEELFVGREKIFPKIAVYYNENGDENNKLIRNRVKYLISSYYIELTLSILYNYDKNPYLGKKVNGANKSDNYGKYDEFVKKVAEDFLKVAGKTKQMQINNDDVNKRLVFESYTAYDFLLSLMNLLENEKGTSLSKFPLSKSLCKYIQIPCVFGRSYFVQLANSILKEEVKSADVTESADDVIKRWEIFNDRLIEALSREIIPLFTYAYFILFFEIQEKRDLQSEGSDKGWTQKTRLDRKINNMKKELMPHHKEIEFTYLEKTGTIRLQSSTKDIKIAKISSRRVTEDAEMELMHLVFTSVFEILKRKPVMEPLDWMEECIEKKMNISPEDIYPYR